MACTVSKLISLSLYCLLAWKIMWFEHYFIKATIFKILYAKILQNWYNKLSCVNERVHSWLRDQLTWVTENVVLPFHMIHLVSYVGFTNWIFKWDVARLCRCFFSPTDSVCPKGTSEAIVCILWVSLLIAWKLLQFLNESSIYAIRALTLEYWWLVKLLNNLFSSIQTLLCLPHMFFFTSIQFKCCKGQICFLTIFRVQNFNDV